MKKLKQKIYITLFIYTLGCINNVNIQAKSESLEQKEASAQKFTALHSAKKKNAKMIPFTADKKWKNQSPQGTYNHKNNTASIGVGKNSYKFINIIEDRNPTIKKLSKKKNLPDNLVPIGFFTKKFTRDMPIVIYLYGQRKQSNVPDHINKTTKRPAQKLP